MAGDDSFEASEMHDGAPIVHRDKKVSRGMAAMLALPGRSRHRRGREAIEQARAKAGKRIAVDPVVEAEALAAQAEEEQEDDDAKKTRSV